jgi:DNA-binding transcriptional MerR regulator
MPQGLKIGQLAQAAGVSAKTIRYYEQVGVLPPANRTAAGYRQYAEHSLHRLLLIRGLVRSGCPCRISNR